MIDAVSLVLCLVASRFKSRVRLEAEVLLLRHQLAILRRKAPRRLHLRAIDRLIFVWAYRLRPSVLDAMCIVQPETVLRWHRTGFRWYWRWKSRSKGGRPPIPNDWRRLIREMSTANPLWGAPRIHGELMMLGIKIAQSTVAKYMARGRRPPSQSWKTFLCNHAGGIAAMDLLVVPTIGFRLTWGGSCQASFYSIIAISSLVGRSEARARSQYAIHDRNQLICGRSPERKRFFQGAGA
jgi:hypothetical protein